MSFVSLNPVKTPVRFGADASDNNGNGPKKPDAAKPETKKPEAKKPDAKPGSKPGGLGDMLPRWVVLAAGAKALLTETVNRGMDTAYATVLGEARNKRVNLLDAVARKAQVQADQNLMQALYQQLRDKYNKPLELLNLKTVDEAITGIETDLRKKVDAKLGAGQFDKMLSEIQNNS